MLFTDILVKNGLIGQGKLAKVIIQSEETGITLEKALKAEGISGDDILNAKSKISGLAIKKVFKGQVLFDTLKKIPEEAARHYRFVPLMPKELCSSSFPERICPLKHLLFQRMILKLFWKNTRD